MHRRVHFRPVLAAVALTAIIAACAGSGDDGGDGATESDVPTVTAEPQHTPTSLPVATPTATPEPTATPIPTATPTPTATPIPTPTPSPTPVDTTPVVIPGDGWAITEADVERMHRFVEQVHELDFTRPVTVEFDDDIGADFAAGIELLPEDEWRIYVALGLIPPEFDREAVSQFRRDRIRGVCCAGRGDDLTVIVEPMATKLETEVIVVHELVHALHRQHPELFGPLGPSGGFELPDTYNAVIEAIPQLVAFRYLDTAPPDQQAIVEPELLIVKPDRLPLVGEVPAAILNFAYFGAPPLAEAVYDELGAQGLSDLLGRPPTTTEQVVFPDAWLAGEDRVSQDPPVLPSGAQFIDEGRLGAAMLEWMIGPPGEVDLGVRALLERWTGDRWSLYRLDGQECIAAVVEMDDLAAAEELAERVGEHLGQDLAADDDRRLRFDTCAT